MKICDKCSVANDDKAVFCVGCGAVLQRAEEAAAETVNTAEAQPIPVPAEPTAETVNEAPTAPVQGFTPPAQGFTPPPAQPAAPFSPVVQPVSAPAPAFQQPPIQPPYGYTINPAALPIEYQPATLGEYILYGIGFGIPALGIVLLLVTAFGSGKKISLKNYAKATLLLQVIGVVIGVVMVIAMTAFGFMMDY